MMEEMKQKRVIIIAALIICGCCEFCPAIEVNENTSSKDTLYTFNRAPLIAKPYTELPLKAIQPTGWLKNELQRMADGMTGHLDEWYPEVCGPRNAWLGGDGDCWERGPYWIDGLYPLSYLLDDKTLQPKAQKWVEWVLENQREDGYIGPVNIKEEDRKMPPPEGSQIWHPDDWWPRMVMLKILQQHYMATGDERVIEVMTRYFKYQLKTLPEMPLKAPPGGKGGSWWAQQRGGDNLMSVLWLYNITGDKWLLDLADLIYKQTLPFTDIFLKGDALKITGSHTLTTYDSYALGAFHCVNLAQGMKTPIIRYQQDHDVRHLHAIDRAFHDIELLYGQPNGLYGADEAMHGRELTRGSELCTAVEMLYSLEQMLEITGQAALGDRIERIAFNPLPTQCRDDYRSRQYYQQANQVEITAEDRPFFEGGGKRLVYSLLDGYPCCTCNLNQGWPKFVQHLWMASSDRGLAALIYGPSRVTAKVANGSEVTFFEKTNYPFDETISFIIETSKPVEFPLHLRIPQWCRQATIRVNNQILHSPQGGQIFVLKRLWKSGDCVELILPMSIRKSYWYERSVTIERGPLIYALRMEEQWSEVKDPVPQGIPQNAMHRGYFECRSQTPWNYAFLESQLKDPNNSIKVIKHEMKPGNPWNLSNIPIELQIEGVQLSGWTLYQHSAGPVPLSPVSMPNNVKTETLRLIPYGCTTLRISAFPWVGN